MRASTLERCGRKREEKGFWLPFLEAVSLSLSFSSGETQPLLPLFALFSFFLSFPAERVFPILGFLWG